MREIIFRGKTLQGEWVQGYYAKKIVGKFDMTTYSEEPRDFIITGFSSGGIAHIEVIPETVGQFTGFRDKNGREIYEGDIVRCWGGEHSQGYWAHDIKVTIKDLTYDCFMMGELEFLEVIGNIHDEEVSP